MKFRYLLIVSTLLLSDKTIAQTFEISGQIRPRSEYKHGYKSLIGNNVDPAFNISQLTRLNLNYTSKQFCTGISLQDVRVWGDVTISNKSDLNGMMIYQAWGELFLTEKFSIKAGRQTISLDDQRIFGTSDWIQQSRSHDAFLLKLTQSKTTLMQAGFAYNQSAEKDTGNFYSVNNYKALQYLWAHHEIKKLSISFLFVNNGMPSVVKSAEQSKQEIRYTQTFGPFLTLNINKLKVNLAGYYQMGKNNKNIGKSAWYSGGDIVYSLKKLGFGAGFQYLSGNDQVNPDTKDHEFSTLYGSGHKFNGWMDYFYAGNSHKGVGLLDIYIPVSYKKGKLSSEMQLHYYRAAAGVKDTRYPDIAMNAELGTEAGIMLSYTFSPDMNISAGYSQMLGTETLQAIKGGNRENTQNWAWMMLTFNPTFFKSEK